MQIKEVTDKVTRTVKKNPLLIAGAIGGVALFFILSKKDNKVAIEEEEKEGLIAYNGAYASYPDAATNAETIISSMTENLNYAMEGMREDFTEQLGAFDERLTDLNEKRWEDREYINESMDSVKELFQQNNELMLETIRSQVDNLTSGSMQAPTSVQYVTNNTYVTGEDAQKPEDSFDQFDLPALSNSLAEERLLKETKDRDEAFRKLTNAQKLDSALDRIRSGNVVILDDSDAPKSKGTILKDVTQKNKGNFTAFKDVTKNTKKKK